MTHKEFIADLAAVQERLRDAKREYELAVNRENDRHNDAAQNERMLHELNMRELSTDYYEANKRLMAEQKRIRMAWAEEKENGLYNI